MDDVLKIVLTILATGGVMVLGNWAQHHWASKREVSNARRKYREDIARNIREALKRAQDYLAWDNLMNLMDEAEKKGAQIKQEYSEFFKEYKEERKAQNLRETYTEFFPLTASITNEEAEKTIKDAFGCIALNAAFNDFTTEDEVKNKIKLAYQALEDFVTEKE